MSKGVVPNPMIVLAEDEQWIDHLAQPGLRVVDAYAKWAGPCEAMQPLQRKLKSELQANVTFIAAQTDAITQLIRFRNKSQPLFLFYFNGVLVKVLHGANAPAFEKAIREQIEIEKAGHAHAPYVFEDEMGTMSQGAAAAAAVSRTESVVATDRRTSLKDATPEGEVTVAIIKPDAMHPAVIEEIIEIMKRHRLDIIRKRKLWLNTDQAGQFYAEHKEKAFYPHLIKYMTSGPVLAFLLHKDEGTIKAWRELAGPTNSKLAKDTAPKSIRAQFGTDGTMNAVHGSDSPASAAREQAILFDDPSVLEMIFPKVEGAAALQQKTLCLVKPDAIPHLDEIIERILFHGFQVIKREEVEFGSSDRTNEMLQDIYPEGPVRDEAVAFLDNSPSVGLVLRGDDVIRAWLELIGPADPEEAKRTYPMSIRAMYGTDFVHNAVHGSTSPETAQREINFLFPKAGLKSASSQWLASSNPSLTGSKGNLVKGSKGDLVKGSNNALSNQAPWAGSAKSVATPVASPPKETVSLPEATPPATEKKAGSKDMLAKSRANSNNVLNDNVKKVGMSVSTLEKGPKAPSEGKSPTRPGSAASPSRPSSGSPTKSKSKSSLVGKPDDMKKSKASLKETPAQ
ncbi:nucleoside-diphosphate kinase [Synchytrium microbalum]|uniref:Nucleoside diphosphate kinase n=1 Tax=Synchytrium microbalum TaxID=1806994 RepID=A0A507BX08_9FUNG|nr:nucleoside-diphosphate kinase [Synchytrium microbalum]TPX33870.1 nucleoside-diphosphate kinase [Synchytrium microbalum]